ncbi:hypothetical protein SERLA73DRAFT_156710 [Serpula lacrymans var. lacrymans S7.3]|uniref:Pentacotripeptide-repeat region of PRORP domain-containing protein n=2 Tax=Serpula lacrymans var. lacrymans TaxID=341189 RepID=F8QFL8_SERL3|nr:uncharacterized protein SERLADRAFT_405591 [Serpula lacrymans var. lacrymans S7.9]EGN92852.1 hypothetical protein SERLA73DRAFT_156710 [Serpula lacrymans var. lacrymans S7.3]EGO29685.1 hypothetical protein SERLADRAFT_405591 [Serpula lacrymans var. lacrymans S7.9]
MPYPPNPPDTSIFEDVSEEYVSAKSHVVPIATPRAALTSSDALALLVANNDWKAADSLLEEMIELDVPIKPDFVYEKAAIHALTSNFHNVKQQRASVFAKWFMLVPSAQKTRRSFYRIRFLIFGRAASINIPLIMRFGLICASKGYVTSQLSSQVISTVMRFAVPEISETYLCQFEERAVFYEGGEQKPLAPSFLKYIYSLAIRTQVLAGRFNAALRLLELAHQRKHQISDFTFNLFFEHAKDKADIAKAQELRTLLSDTPGAVFSKVDRSATTASSSKLASQLRYLRKAIISSNPPTAYTLLSFIKEYRKTGKVKAIMMLRSKAYRHSYKPMSLWVMAEMLYHRERNERLLTIFVYFTHFSLAGLPARTIRNWMFQLYRLRSSSEKKWKVPAHLTSPQYPISAKIWPSTFHTALVWEALCWLSPEVSQDKLYSSLLRIAESSEKQIPYITKKDHYTPSYLMLPKRSVDPAHFSPFIKLHAKRARPERATAIVADMIRLGLEPTAYQWTMVARGYAEFGDPDKAILVLDKLTERACITTEQALSALQCDDETISDEPHYLAELEDEEGVSNAIIVTYTNVLRGFILSNRLAHAIEVEKRIMEQCQYHPGERPATDDVLRLLRELKGSQGQP